MRVVYASMLINAKTLNTYDVDASDGPAGTVVDTRFDDTLWHLEDFIVNTRNVVGGRHVLIPMGAVRQLDPERLKMSLALLQQQVDTAPVPPNDGESSSSVRSTRAVMGYHIRARDETFGHLEDLLIEPLTWVVRYLLIDTRNWWPGPPVLVAPDWVSEFDWVDRKLAMDVTAEQIKRCPPYDPSLPPSRAYETVLYQYYGRTQYWQ
jgi:hypothetical protein